MIYVINHFQCHLDLYSSNIQFIETSRIHLGTLFFKILGNFEIDFEQCDQFQKMYFALLGGGTMVCVCLGHQKVIRRPCLTCLTTQLYLASAD